MMNNPMRVVLVDPHELAREGLCILLNARHDIEAALSFETVEEVVSAALTPAPRVAVLTVGPGDGEAVRRIRSAYPACAIVVMLARESLPPFDLIRAGARGCITKKASFDTMLGAIQAVSHGASYLSPDLLKGYLAAESADPGPAEIRRRLSFSERRVMTLVARGLGSRQIAGHLSIDMETVRSHRRSLMRKLGVHNAASLTRMALTLNLVLEEEEEGGTAGLRPSAPLLAEVRR